MDTAALVMVFTQLIVMVARLFQVAQKDDITQTLILLIGYIIIDATLYYFVFEMKYVAMKLKCNSVAEYRKEVLGIKRAKYLALGGLLVFYAPTVNLSYILSVTLQTPGAYYPWIVGLLLFNRAIFASTESYIYYQYASLLRFFIEKKRQIIRFRLSARTSSQVKGSKRFTRFNRFVIGWITVLTVLKLSHTFFILFIATVFQLSTSYRSETFKRSVLVIQRLYIPLIDLLIVSSLLYYFYYQGATLQAMRDGNKKAITKSSDGNFDIRSETLDSDGVGTEDVRDLLLNGTGQPIQVQEDQRHSYVAVVEPDQMFGSAAKKVDTLEEQRETGNFEERDQEEGLFVRRLQSKDDVYEDDLESNRSQFRSYLLSYYAMAGQNRAESVSPPSGQK
ncbi:hypothetical protein FGO68_gene3452 [Halteria grandinella]|uniref:Uncharacterized protein n=1 Tax=Halteria grandinella TaxID=5974 RepID=A0A8J8T1V2_HALGN|nr:hypothetical protein FGO68_gene3452 [Halteria grandinella]